jgi:hypothetical protein
MRTLRHMGWQVGDLVYAYFPVLNDGVLDACNNAMRNGDVLTVIVPKECEFLMRHAMDDALGNRAPVIFSVGNFLSWRVTFAAADLSVPRELVVLDLVKKYNRGACRLRLAPELLIGVPRPGAALRSTRRIR